jgi:hypothetical protein
MHEPIDTFPTGRVVGSCRLARQKHSIDVTRLRHGSATRFVESVTVQGRYGPVRTALRRTDDFPSDQIADRFIGEWLRGIVQNRKYRLLHKDPQFDSAAEQEAQQQ